LRFDAQNFTQLPLQPSSAELQLKLHPLINEFSMVKPMSVQADHEKIHCQKWRLYKVRRPFSKPSHAKEERNGPPSAN